MALQDMTPADIAAVVNNDGNGGFGNGNGWWIILLFLFLGWGNRGYGGSGYGGSSSSGYGSSGGGRRGYSSGYGGPSGHQDIVEVLNRSLQGATPEEKEHIKREVEMLLR